MADTWPDTEVTRKHSCVTSYGVKPTGLTAKCANGTTTMLQGRLIKAHRTERDHLNQLRISRDEDDHHGTNRKERRGNDAPPGDEAGDVTRLQQDVRKHSGAYSWRHLIWRAASRLQLSAHGFQRRKLTGDSRRQSTSTWFRLRDGERQGRRSVLLWLREHRAVVFRPRSRAHFRRRCGSSARSG